MCRFIFVFLIIYFSFFFDSISLRSQSIEVVDTCSPSWITDSVLMYVHNKVEFGVSRQDNGIIIPNDSGEIMFIANVPSKSTILSSVASDVSINVLAWQSLRVDTFGRRSILCYAEYLNNYNASECALIIVVSHDSGGVWKVPVWNDKPLKRFSRKITNNDIYDFLEEINAIEAKMFIYDLNGEYNWRGVSVTFLEGHICEGAWEEKIGEKPTKAFPAVKTK